MQQLSKFILFTFLFIPFFGFAQLVTDDFSDGNFTSNPAWSGDTEEFIVNGSNQLQSNGPSSTATLHLVTENTSFENVSWSIWVNLDFSPSSSNYSRIYLMSDQADLEGDLNGYYIELGESGSNDAIELYRQEGSNRTEIFSLNDGAIASAFTIGLKVTRDNAGLWTVSVDYTGGTSYTELGSVTDNTIQATSYFGVLAQHSSTRNDLFYFDDVLIDNLPDSSAPTISSINVVDANNIEVFFDEDLEQTSAETPTNYSVNNSIGQPTSATRDGTDNTKVTLTFSNAFTDDLENSIEIINVKDLSDNAIPSGTPATANFTYFAPDVTPPVLTGVSVVALNQIYVAFDEIVEQASAETLGNYSMDNGIGSPNAAQRDGTDQNKVLLTFDNNFTIGTEYEVSVQNIQDSDGNITIGTLTINFIFTDIFPPEINQLVVIASNALDVYFNEPVDETTSQEISNYSKNDGESSPVTAVRDQTNINVIHLFFPDNFNENSDIELTIINVADTTGNPISGSLTNDFQYDTKNPTVCTTCTVPVSSNELDIEFSEKVDLTTSQILNNYEVTANVEGYQDIGFPISATRDESDSTVRLVFSTEFEQEIEYNVRITQVRDLVGNIMTTRNRQFTYDTTPPSLAKLTILSSDTLQLTFSEVVDATYAEIATNYTIDNSIGNPTSVEVFEGDQSIVKLYFSSGLGDTDNLILTIENIADVLGNTMAEANEVSFSTLAPSIAKVTVISKTQVNVLFSESVETTSAQLLTNYLIDKNISNPTSAIQDESNGALVVINFENGLITDTLYNITITNISDLNTNFSGELSSSLAYQTRVNKVVASSNNLVEILLSKTPVEAEAENVNTYSVNNGIGNPLSATSIVTIDDDDTTRMLQLAFPNIADDTNYELTLGPIALENGKTIPISTHNFILDKTPPTVAKAEIIDDHTIQVYFSEDVDEIIAEGINHYEVDNGLGNPTEVNLSSNDSLAVLTFTGTFNFETVYQFTVNNIKDLNGLELVSEQLNIQRPTPPNFGEIVITEIFADPEPVVGLPEKEFLEIYNNSDQTINLVGLQISDPTTTATLPSYELAAGNYLILVSNGSGELFESFGNVLEVSNFPSLNSDDEDLTIIAPDGDLVFDITYDQDWYQDDVKKNGGYSLEIIDITLFNCHSESNWIASNDPSGGTPGSVNSVNGVMHDQVAPDISALLISQSNQLKITFNEDIDSLTLIEPGNYSIDNGVSVISTNYINERDVYLNLDTELDTNTYYSITFQNVADCANNQSNDTNYFGIGFTPDQNELIISEIFADENPQVGLPLVEYIEVFNRSSKLLNLREVVFSDATDQTELSELLLLPDSFLVMTTISGTDSFPEVNVLGISGFPSLNSSSDELTLKTSEDVIINSVAYDISWYQDSDKDDGGYSLEIIDPDNVCNGIENWIASDDPLGGTPGKINSVNADNPDETAPEISKIKINNPSDIELHFSEKMDTSSVFTDISNFNINNGIAISSISKIDEFSVRLSLDVAISDIILYQISIINLTDCAGNLIGNESIGFGIGVTPDLNELIITEIFADENPQVGLPLVEYIEVFNRSEKLLNLNNLVFGDQVDQTLLTGRFLLPDSFMVITKSSAVDSFPEVNVMGVSGFPSLNSSGDFLFIATLQGDMVNNVSYEISWYQDAIKDNGGYSLELIDPDNTCSEMENWIASNDPLGGTPGKINSVDAENPDLEAPSIVDITVNNLNELKLIFSENMDTSSVFTDATNYVISNGINVSGVTKVDETAVILNLESPLSDIIYYQINLQNITDCAGNLLSPLANFFGIGVTPEINEIIFTEIYADETPQVGLPNFEYLEIYNRSDKLLNLDGLFLNDENGELLLTNSLILPGTYTVLTKINGVINFPDIRVLGNVNFPSLNNTGELISLTKEDGTVINSVDYDLSWYGDEDKDSGGYSLEIIDLENLCNGKENWTASTNVLGGTPGLVNSVNGSNPDVTKPFIESIKVLSDTQIELVFSEKMDTSSVFTEVTNYAIDNGIVISNVSKIDDRTVAVFLGNNLSQIIYYELSIQNITDCAGNSLETSGYNFGIGLAPAANELVITEIFADEEPQVGLPLVEYIEVFNRSSKLLNIEGLTLKDATDETILTRTIMQAGTYLVLTKTTAVDQFPGVDVLGVSGIPSLNNSGDLVQIVDGNGVVINEVNYTDEWYKDSDKDNGGYALEIIDPDNVCNGIENWIASEAAIGGTPGLINSVDADNPDVAKPDITNVTIISSTEIEVFFSEKMDVSSIFTDPNNYNIDNGLGVTEVLMIDEQLVRVTFSPELAVGTIYTLSISNISDCAGNLLDISSFEFQEATQPTIVEVNVLSNTKIEVVFSEPMKVDVAITDVNNYVISNDIQAAAITIINETTIEVTLSEALDIGQPFTLSISNLSDLAGNQLTTTPIDFGIGAEISFNDIVISEIHSFPSSINQLPEVEFIELYNRTDELLSLAGLRLIDEKNELTIPASTDELPNTVIQPGEYIILTSLASVYESYGKVIEIPDWKTDQLSKTGESLTLSKSNGTLIFEINYDDSWYQSLEAKEDGGVSLEMIDTNNPCGESNNWRASVNANGGTPGSENSIKGSIQDQVSPNLIKAEASDANTLRLTFDEKLPEASVIAATYLVDNGITATFKEFNVPNTNKVILELSPELEPGVKYTVTVNGLQDCLDNIIGNNTFEFQLPEAANETDILINEILFNPESNGTDYVELYNNSEKYINLQGWQIANRSSRKLIFEEVLVLAPNEYLVLTSDIEDLKNTFPNGADSTYLKVSLPSYPDDEGSVLLYDNSEVGVLMQEFDYNDDFHFALLDDEEGVSLERISFDQEVNNQDNWKSASSISGYGTPGYLNSQNINNPNTPQEDCFELSTELFAPEHNMLDNVVYVNYGCNNLGPSISITVFDLNGRAVRHLVSNGSLGANGLLPPWDGTDDSGSKVRVGYYIIFIETFDLDGNVKKVKKTVAVGARF